MVGKLTLGWSKTLFPTFRQLLLPLSRAGEDEIHVGVVLRVRPSQWLAAECQLCGVECPLHTAQTTVIPRRRARSLIIGPLISSPTSSLDVCGAVVVVSNEGGTSHDCWWLVAGAGSSGAATGVVWSCPCSWSWWLGGLAVVCLGHFSCRFGSYEPHRLVCWCWVDVAVD